MMFTLSLPSWIRRAARAPAAPPRAFELLAGQQQCIELAPGEALRIDSGRVLLQWPARWLAETLVRPSQVLRAGDVHRCVERTAVTLVANETSRVQRLV
jgi:hypothetical protein